jgi:adenylylsulfate kinase-like enzyme
MSKAKLIMLYGFAASGKTTLSNKYLSLHPQAISIEGDRIINMMEQWRKREMEARKIVFEDIKALTKEYLGKGRVVLLPYLLTDHTQAETFKRIADEMSATFHEVFINIERGDAIARLLKRGVWGEAGSPELTESDLPEINELYDRMEKAMDNRGGTKVIKSDLGDIDGTYTKFIMALA